MPVPIDRCRSAADVLECTLASAQVLVGFDGFIDEIVQLVDTRESMEAFTPIPTIEAFGRRILAAAGLSCNIEMVPRQIKLGGNGPIMANNLVEQGYRVTYCGAIGGGGGVNPVFAEFAERCAQVISLCEPGHTDAVEFEDGKVMLGKMNTLPQVNWRQVVDTISEEGIQAMWEQVALIGCVNWTMLPEMNSILEGIGSVFADSARRPFLFVDLADPQKRSREDIAGVLDLLSALQQTVEVVLGLNENESRQIAGVLGEEAHDLSARARTIRARLGLKQVVVHPTRGAAVATAEGEWFVEGPYTSKPKLTTGAGDNFNAGYCNGLLSGLEPGDCLIAGVCSSGFYVRNCRSATRQELVAFMRQWADAGCGEME